MTDAWAQAESERIQGNLIRVGRIIEVDAPNARAKMAVGGLETDWLHWGVARAGGTRTASAPTVGEQRLLFSPYGDTSQGVIGPAIYQDDHAAPTDSATVETTVFSDGTSVSYDTETHALLVTVVGGSVTVKCDEATIDAPTTTLTGDLVVEGDATFNGGSVTHGGKDIGKTHKHSGVETGGGNTGAPN